ncbi:hypothetical protein BH23THE1_BH23THE1_34330 [soil metagenome]
MSDDIKTSLFRPVSLPEEDCIDSELESLCESMTIVHSLLNEQKEKLTIIESKTVSIPSKINPKVITDYNNTKPIVYVICGALIGTLGFCINPVIGTGTVIIGGWSGLTISKIKQ